MNYLSHLFLSQRTPMSLTGNLMGDFKRDLVQQELPDPILKGIENHRFVDKCTDQSSEFKQLKEVFSTQRRRFAGIISDIAFDYFLIKHWDEFEESSFNEFVDRSYAGLLECEQYMPEKMARVIKLMTKNDWLRAYSSLEGIDLSINQVAKRIRFENQLLGGIEEVKDNYAEFDQIFLALFPQLIKQVKDSSIETSV